MDDNGLDEVHLSEEDEIKARVIAARRVLKLNTFSREKTLELYRITEEDIKQYGKEDKKC